MGKTRRARAFVLALSIMVVLGLGISGCTKKAEEPAKGFLGHWVASTNNDLGIVDVELFADGTVSVDGQAGDWKSPALNKLRITAGSLDCVYEWSREGDALRLDGKPYVVATAEKIAEAKKRVADATAAASDGATSPQLSPEQLNSGSLPAGHPNIPATDLTAVPSGQTPKEFVTAYHKALAAGDYQKAFGMLPRDKQQSYGDASSFGETIKSYGVTGYEVESAITSGDSASVVAWMKTPNGSFGYKWVFEKVSGTWYVKAREQAGMK